VASQSHLKPAHEPTAEEFRKRSRPMLVMSIAAAVIGLVAAVVLGSLEHDHFRRFYFSYLTSFAFFLAIGLGAIVFTLIQFLVRAGWSVQVRRVAENMMMIVPVLGIMSLPILISVVIQKGDLYRWALPEETLVKHEEPKSVKPGAKAADGKAGEHGPAGSSGIAATVLAAADHSAPATASGDHSKGHADAGHGAAGGHAVETHRPFHLDELTHQKTKWLNWWFWLIRVVIYFGVWSVIAIVYHRHSVAQDQDGDIEHTAKLQKYSGACLVLMGFTVTYAAFDLFMSLDPHWFSTMFGVYYIAGCALSFWAALIILVTLARKLGHLKGVTKDHYHDMGKFQFGFTFFWGYIAFSQFMLLWYANIPETIPWLSRRGATTAVVTQQAIATYGSYEKALPHIVAEHGFEWRPIALALLIGHLFIPFAGLLSRHVKRKVPLAVFWATWALVFHYVNMYWVVMPEMRIGFHPHIIDLACFIGLFGVCAVTWLKVAGRHRLLPVHDPRLSESLAFTNI